jgi:predicted ATPase/class 3 adenylate cyclase
LPTENLTFLFTDIEGSTALLQRVGEESYGRMLGEHHAVIRSALAVNSGEEVAAQGDGFFAVFSSTTDCVRAVVAMQSALQTHAWPDGESLRVRMGVHTGRASRTATGLVGLDIHRAARVGAVAHGGQVVLSDSAAAVVRNSVPTGVSLRDLGAHRLKDLGRPERLWQVCVPDLQEDFPPLRSLDNPALRNNLPAQVGSFVGREREQDEVRALVGSSRLVTLTGSGGSGKTRLALQVAAELLDASGDGVWLVELAALSDPDLVAPCIFQAIGLVSQPGRSPLDTLIDALAWQDMLIVLDNCEHLIGACAKTADAILRGCPRVHLLATSREPLGIDGEAVYRVPSLSLPEPDTRNIEDSLRSDAVDLFVDRAKSQGIDLSLTGETGRLVASICRRLDGMPLAIELAAARLRSLSVVDLSDRLDQRFRLLTGGSRGALERQQTLRATVDWSYSLLNDRERLLLRRLSVFAEGFELEAAEAVSCLDDIDVLDVVSLLSSLVDKSLVQAEPSGKTVKYRLLETIRQFAAEQLVYAAETEAEAVATAHGRYYLSLAEAVSQHLTGPSQAKWLMRLDADQANLRRAFEHAVSGPDNIEQALRFGIALKRYCLVRLRDDEILTLLCPILDRPAVEADLQLLGAGFVAVAMLSRFADRVTKQMLCERAVQFARQIESTPLLIEGLMALSHSCAFRGDPDSGVPYATEALDLARSLGDDVLFAGSMVTYLLCTEQKDPVDAQRLYDEGIDATIRSGDLFLSRTLRNNAGNLALMTGHLDLAREHFQQAAQIRDSIRAVGVIEQINLGWVLRAEADIAGARSMFEECGRISRRSGDRLGLAHSILGLACIAGDEGAWDRATFLHGLAQSVLDQIDTTWLPPDSKYRLASIDQARVNIGRERYDRIYTEAGALALDEAVDSIIERLARMSDHP